MPEIEPKIPFNNENRAKSSIKSLNFELSNLTPSALVTMFEINLTKLMETKGINLQDQAKDINFPGDVNDGILRFHNNINIFNSYIIWRGKTYYPAPIAAEGFESTTKGVLPQPSLTIASQSETGADQLALLKHEIKKFGDIIGSKVIRRRTFAKYLDRRNFLGGFVDGGTFGSGAGNTSLPQGYEPDPYAELPIDVYFIERKQTENKNVLTYQLSSALDMEGTKIPKRVIVSDKCVWQYRGIGCWYQCKEGGETSTYSDEKFPPLLKKAEISKLGAGGINLGLPAKAAPIANDKDERIAELINKSVIETGPWRNNITYKKGDAVYLAPEGDHVKYYFVCNTDGTIGADTIPPNGKYWIADECSKSLTGCRLRWGAGKGAAGTGAIKKGELPFGGFPAARKMSRLG